jgi:prepilin-type N-terminal cleavage/methylation domain-containing protein/prepilin-type processing-associated H-X9-DG protein
MRARPGGRRGGGFTLVELLTVIAIVAALMALVAPSLGRALDLARRTQCASNVREVQLAFLQYLQDHDGEFFPWREDVAGGTLWYWGLETGGGTEGSRPIDRSRARLARYLGPGGGVEICPSLPYRRPDFKRKFALATYGYGLNIYMLAGTPDHVAAGRPTWYQVLAPSETVAWGDAAQVNTWQAPASPSRPMLEEWYYLSNRMPPANFHFRHGGIANAAMGDGSVRALPPDRLDPRCDGLTGFVEPLGSDRLLRLAK